MKEFKNLFIIELRKNNNETIVPFMEKSIKTLFEKFGKSLEVTFTTFVSKLKTESLI